MKKRSQGTILLAVGLPGSGKSGWFRRRGIQPLSTDTLRLWLLDDETDQQSPRSVFAALRMLLRTRLRLGRPLSCVDATNLTPRERKPYVEMARKYGYSIQAVYFDIPLEECLRRNRRRKRTVPRDVMERFARKLVPPSAAEGFEKITVVRLRDQQSVLLSL